MNLKQAFGVFTVILTLIFFCCAPAAAGDGALDPSFNPGLGVSKIPIIRGQANWTTGGYANGNSLVWGYFTSMTDGSGDHPVNSIAKLVNFSGTVDPSFSIPVKGPDGTGVGEVRGAFLTDSTNLQCDIIILGTFSLAGSDNNPYYNLARLTNSGSGYAVDTKFPHIFNQSGGVNAIFPSGTYKTSGYVLVGGYNMQVQGDTTHAYHLIRLTISNGDYAYDPNYGPTNAYTRGKSLPGGCVDAIRNNSGQPRLFGTLPVSDGNGHWTGHFHWFEAFASDATTFQKSLGDQPTSGNNLGPIDGPVFNMVQPLSGNPNSPWIIVGTFTNVYGRGLNHVAQLTYDLTGLDDTTNNFNANVGSGTEHAVQQIIMQGNGQPILAGSMTAYNGTPCGHIVRLYYDATHGYGTVDPTFHSTGSFPGADDRIFGIYGLGISLTESHLQILGSFRNYNGTAQGGLATLNWNDGSLNNGFYSSPFAANSNTPGMVYAMDHVYVSNGQTGQSYLVIGGDFTGVNGKFSMNLAYLNLDGSLAKGYCYVVDPVRNIRGLENGDVLLAGNFEYVQGYGCTGVARLNPDGSFDSSFRPMVTRGDGRAASVHMVNNEDNGNVDIGGNFSTLYDSSHNPQTRNAFAVLDPSGYDTGYNAQINIPNGSKIKVNAGGNMGSGYGMAGYVLYNNTYDYGFGCVLDQSGNQQTYMLFNGEVLCGAGHGGSTGIVLGGNFTQVLYPVSAARGHIAALTSNFTLDNSSFAGTGTNGPIYALSAEGDNDQGKPIIGGVFSTYNGVGRNNVARLNLNGSLDTAFNPGTGATGPVYAIRWMNWDNNGPNSGKALLGGAFTSYNGTSRPGIARVLASLGSINPGYLMLLLGN